MEQYDDIVAGSGIGGLTMAALLALNGRRVLLLEKAPYIGGSLRRFYKEGVPFDTGFHFTGGFSSGGVLAEMLKVLGIEKDIVPVYLDGAQSNRVILREGERVFTMPFGIAATIAALKEYFPQERAAIEQYFSLVDKVCARSISLGLRNLAVSLEPLDEDFISLSAVLDSLTRDKLLKAVLCSYDMCYGVKPSEVSFANHARVCYSLHDSIARVKDGGDAFVRAFEKLLRKLSITLLTNSCIDRCCDIQDSIAHGFVLNNGHTVKAKNCVFTIHPQEAVKALPREKLSKAFLSRVAGFEPSIGFFSLFARVDTAVPPDFKPAIVTDLPSCDSEALLSPGGVGKKPLVLMQSIEEHNGRKHLVLAVFEVSFFEDVKKWQATRRGGRGPGYEFYKQQRRENILRRVFEIYPQYRAKVKVLECASQLTFRDYLHSPYGCAYGIKQKLGQFNLFGKLPIRNVFAAGQSAFLPGIVGAMLSSFIVARSIVGKDNYQHFIGKKLCA